MKIQVKKYNPNMDLELDLDPELTLHNELRWEIDEIWARDRVGPKLRSKGYNPNMDLKLDLYPELTPSTMS